MRARAAADARGGAELAAHTNARSPLFFPLFPPVFNLVDKSDTDQGALSRMLGAIFGIEVGFYGSIMSNLAATKLDSIVNDANASHLAPWMAQIKEAGIKQTPLSPFLHKQLLQNNHLAVDGAAIEAAGFKLAVAELTDESLRDTIAQAITQGIFPVSARATRARPARARAARRPPPLSSPLRTRAARPRGRRRPGGGRRGQGVKGRPPHTPYSPLSLSPRHFLSRDSHTWSHHPPFHPTSPFSKKKINERAHRRY